MKYMKTTLLLFVTVLVLAACDTSDTTSSTVGSADLGNVVVELQDAADELEAVVSNSDVASDLSSAWDAVESRVAEIAAGTADLQAGFSDELDAFEGELESLGDRAGEDLTAAWAEFRRAFESTVEELTSG